MIMTKGNTTPAYVSRDEDSDIIWFWLKPKKGNWKPEKLKDCDVVNYQRPSSMDELTTYNYYTVKEFKARFGFIINKKTVKHVHLQTDKIKTIM